MVGARRRFSKHGPDVRSAYYGSVSSRQHSEAPDGTSKHASIPTGLFHKRSLRVRPPTPAPALISAGGRVPYMSAIMICARTQPGSAVVTREERQR